MTVSTEVRLFASIPLAVSAAYGVSVSPMVGAIAIAGMSAGVLGLWAAGNPRRLLPCAMAVVAVGLFATALLAHYLAGGALAAIAPSDEAGEVPIVALVWVWGFWAVLMPYVSGAAGRLAYMSSEPRRAAVAGIIACSAFFVHLVASDHLVLMPLSNLATKLASSADVLKMRTDAIAETNQTDSGPQASDIDRYVMTKIILGKNGLRGVKPPESFKDFLVNHGRSVY